MSLLPRVLAAALAALSGWYALAFIYIAFYSFNYPFGMEWLEGHVVAIIQRVAEGNPVYTAPSLEYTPFIYTPYYYYVSGIVAKVIGVDFGAGRLVSILSTVGVCAVLYQWVRRKGGNIIHGITAAGLYIGCYRLSDHWYDLARVDNLFMLLLLAGFFVYDTSRERMGAIVAGILFAAAFYTKQSAVMAFAPVLAAGLFIAPRHALITGVTAALAIGFLVLVSNYASGGWFNFYVFEVPAKHGLDKQYIAGFWLRDMANFIPAALLLIALLVALFVRDKRECLAVFALVLGMIGSSYAARLHWGGHVNVLLPAFALFAYASAYALSRIPRIWPTFALAVPVIVIAQFVLLRYHPNHMIPSDEVRKSNQKALEELGKLPGEIFIPDLQFVQQRVGKKSYNFGMAGFDILRTDLDVKYRVEADMKQAYKQQLFGGVVPGALLKLREGLEFYPLQLKMANRFIYPFGIVRQGGNQLYLSITPPKAIDSPPVTDMLPPAAE